MTLGEAMFPRLSVLPAITGLARDHGHHPDRQIQRCLCRCSLLSRNPGGRGVHRRAGRRTGHARPLRLRRRRQLDAAQAALSLWRRPARRRWPSASAGNRPRCASSTMPPLICWARSAPEPPAEFPASSASTLGTGIGSAFAVDGRLVTRAPAFRPAVRFGTSPTRAVSSRISFPPGLFRRTTWNAPASSARWPTIAAAATDDPAAAEVFAEFGRHSRPRSAQPALYLRAGRRGAGRRHSALSASVPSAAQLELQGLQFTIAQSPSSTIMPRWSAPGLRGFRLQPDILKPPRELRKMNRQSKERARLHF